ncbi:MAG: NAD(P)H-hydrate dehydratase [Thermoanaerobaculia bacterium]
MIPVLSARAMRAADRETIRSGVPSLALMEQAAEALADETRRRFPSLRRVVVVCGPGSNGGDGLAAARLLAGRGVASAIFTLNDPLSYQGDAAENAARARAYGLELIALSHRGGLRKLAAALADADGAVDALFGTGLSRALTGGAAAAVAALNASGRPVVAADVPSGLCADSGVLSGPCVRADLTVAFAAPKLCHVFFPARQFCGSVVVRDIGISRATLARLGGKLGLVSVEPDDVRRLLPPRRLDGHKGEFGRLAVIAGSRGKAGAAILCARAALRAGAGLVTVFCPESLEPIVVAALPEAMTLGLEETGGQLAAKAGKAAVLALAGFDAAVVGPGLGAGRGAVEAIEEIARKAAVPLVGDADFLNAFAGRPSLLARRRSPTVLTPHPGEAGRLLGVPVRTIQGDRARAASALSRSTRAVVVLKGAGTLTATPDGALAANPTGTPLLATAGSGDILAGAIGALVAGGLAARDAAIAGVYLHGRAGELMAARLGDAGLLTAELADALPLCRRALCGEPERR